jgi:hypothetical protein
MEFPEQWSQLQRPVENSVRPTAKRRRVRAPSSLPSENVQGAEGTAGVASHATQSKTKHGLKSAVESSDNSKTTVDTPFIPCTGETPQVETAASAALEAKTESDKSTDLDTSVALLFPTESPRDAATKPGVKQTSPSPLDGMFFALDDHVKLFDETKGWEIPLPFQDNVAELQLHTLISRLPYREMLAQMTLDTSTQPREIPIVTRAWEESWMREAVHDGELPCASGANCECMFIDPLQKFIGVQFQLRVGGPSPKLCILCARRTTQELFYEMVYGNPSHEMGGAIQAFGNICGPGEYAREAMLLCPRSGQLHNMPLPIVAHHRHRYTVVVQHNVRRLKQHNVYFEDFHNASS